MLFVGVSLKLLGRAKVHWSVQVSESATEHYSAEEIYINQEVYVFGTRESVLHCVPKNVTPKLKSL